MDVVKKKIFSSSYKQNYVLFDASEIIEMVAKNSPHLSVVQLTNRGLNNSMFRKLCQGLETNNYVHSLEVARNSLNDESMEYLAKVIEKNSTIKSIDISFNKITDEGGKNIQKSLFKNRSIQKLHLEGNDLSASLQEKLLQLSNTTEVLDLPVAFHHSRDTFEKDVRKKNFLLGAQQALSRSELSLPRSHTFSNLINIGVFSHTNHSSSSSSTSPTSPTLSTTSTNTNRSLNTSSPPSTTVSPSISPVNSNAITVKRSESPPTPTLKKTGEKRRNSSPRPGKTSRGSSPECLSPKSTTPKSLSPRGAILKSSSPVPLSNLPNSSTSYSLVSYYPTSPPTSPVITSSSPKVESRGSRRSTLFTSVQVGTTVSVGSPITSPTSTPPVGGSMITGAPRRLPRAKTTTSFARTFSKEKGEEKDEIRSLEKKIKELESIERELIEIIEEEPTSNKLDFFSKLIHRPGKGKLNLSMKSMMILKPVEWKSTKYKPTQGVSWNMVCVDGWLCNMKEIEIPGVNETLVSTFETTLNILEELPQHPNVVRCLFHERFKEKFRLFVSSYTLTLKGYLKYQRKEKKHKSLSYIEMKKAILDIIKGVDFLHSNNFVHREIRSDNVYVLLTPRGELSSLMVGSYDGIERLTRERNSTTSPHASTSSSPGTKSPLISPGRANTTAPNVSSDIITPDLHLNHSIITSDQLDILNLHQTGSFTQRSLSHSGEDFEKSENFSLNASCKIDSPLRRPQSLLIKPVTSNPSLNESEEPKSQKSLSQEKKIERSTSGEIKRRSKEYPRRRSASSISTSTNDAINQTPPTDHVVEGSLRMIAEPVTTIHRKNGPLRRSRTLNGPIAPRVKEEPSHSLNSSATSPNISSASGPSLSSSMCIENGSTSPDLVSTRSKRSSGTSPSSQIKTCYGDEVRWTAPEILTMSYPHSPASDVYSIGMVLLELATLRSPFYKVPIEHIIFLVLDGKYPEWPENDQIEFFGEVGRVYKRATKPKPKQRASLVEIKDLVTSLPR